MALRGLVRDSRFRQVVKVVLAALVAYALAMGKRNDYALFGALGAAMVIGASVAEDLKASLNRVRGTLAGTAVGIAAAMALGTSIVSLGLVVLAVAWLSIGLGWGAPAMRIGLAMALVVLYTHTSDATSYALWRAFYTLVGVAVGLLVGRFVWPVRSPDEIGAAVERTRTATAELLASLARAASAEEVLERQRAALDALAAIRAARKDAGGDVLLAHTRLGARAALVALGASIKLDQLAQAGAPEGAIRELRRVLEAAAERARLTPAHAGLASEFEQRLERATRAAEDPALPSEERRVMAGVLADLELLDRALRSSTPAMGMARPDRAGAS